MRTLRYIDRKIIRNNPKIFLGFSDSTISHFCFYKSGVTSFYGTSNLVGFAENGGMHEYQKHDINRSLFSTDIIGQISPNEEGWTSEHLDWFDESLSEQKRVLSPSLGWRFLQGSQIEQGELLGGCLEVMEWLKDTDYWVRPKDWEGKIMFVETSEEKPHRDTVLRMFRNYAASGILSKINGLIVARPYGDIYWKEYDDALLKVIVQEEGLSDLPIITGMDFGHTCPTFTIPYGVKAEIDPLQKTFSIIESALTD